MLDFRITTFLSVCETLNYTRTAEALSISQPAVSQHIAALEQRMGAPLFERQGKRLSLTDAGKAARAVAQTMVHDERLLKETVAARANVLPPLSMGATLTAGEYLVSGPLARFLAERPDVRINVVQGDTQNLLAQLRTGAIDCAFIEGPFDRSVFQSQVLCSQRLVGVCSPEGMLAKACSVRLENLLGERLIVREEGSGTRAVLEQSLLGCNLAVSSFENVIEVASVNIIKQLVSAGAGIAFLYEAAVLQDIAEGGLARIPLVEELASHDIAFVHLRGSAFAKRFARLYEAIVSRME